MERKISKTAELIHKSIFTQMVRITKTRFEEKIINIPNVEKPMGIGKIYSVITRDLIHLA